ncbi:MAG: 2-oxo acid dehydrogenase subunit E2, partial [Cyclobacteriaceae bacterium]|nr:2-oxo acid dehydrogenase subunit E2 [Cyclobacteriaceae bacterium]
MAEIEIIMPKMGESIMEATILGWLKKEGETIEQDESLLEVATDKVDTEVPSTHGGTITKILANEGDVVPVGQAIARISTTNDGAEKNLKTVSTATTPNGSDTHVVSEKVASV